MRNIINFIFLLAILMLIERLSYSVPKLYSYWYGLFCGIFLYAGYDLFFKEMKKDRYETFK